MTAKSAKSILPISSHRGQIRRNYELDANLNLATLAVRLRCHRGGDLQRARVVPLSLSCHRSTYINKCYTSGVVTSAWCVHVAGCMKIVLNYKYFEKYINPISITSIMLVCFYCNVRHLLWFEFDSLLMSESPRVALHFILIHYESLITAVDW